MFLQTNFLLHADYSFCWERLKQQENIVKIQDLVGFITTRFSIPASFPYFSGFRLGCALLEMGETMESCDMHGDYNEYMYRR